MRRVLIAIAGLIFSPFVFAQTTPTNPNILQAIQQLQNSVNQLQGGDTQELALIQGIQTSLTNIETAIQGLTPTASNVKVSAPVIAFPAQTIRCSVINLASTPKTVTIELVGRVASVPLGQATLSQFGGVIKSRFLNELITEDPFSCRFTVTDGTKADITASVTQINEAGSAVIAVVPAE